MNDTLFDEIADAPGEIFDVIEYKEEWEKEDKFNVEKYINGDTDYWCLSCQPSITQTQWLTTSSTVTNCRMHTSEN